MNMLRFCTLLFWNFVNGVTKLDYYLYIGKIWGEFEKLRRNYKIPKKPSNKLVCGTNSDLRRTINANDLAKYYGILI